ncbi:hypothetical protein SAMN05878391_2440, partial [Salinicoccus kekensis]
MCFIRYDLPLILKIFTWWTMRSNIAAAV